MCPSPAQSIAERTVFPTWVSVPVTNRSLTGIAESFHQRAQIFNSQACRERESQTRRAGRHGGRTNGFNPETAIHKLARHAYGGFIRTQDHGDDMGIGGADIEAIIAQRIS